MNQYSELLIYLKTLAEQDEFINTVTQGEQDEFDLNKANIFPIFHIFINGASFTTGQTVVFDVSLFCVDIRDINKETIEDKFWKQDNEIDNLNEMLASLNKIWVKMLQDFENNNIRIEQSGTLTPLREWDKNLCDGWQLDFTIELPNTTLNLCQ